MMNKKSTRAKLVEFYVMHTIVTRKTKTSTSHRSPRCLLYAFNPKKLDFDRFARQNAKVLV